MLLDGFYLFEGLGINSHHPGCISMRTGLTSIYGARESMRNRFVRNADPKEVL